MIFFESWTEILRVIISASLIYPIIIVLVRLFGKRSTAKMNNFDWIVTVAVGSIMGSAVLLKKVVIVEVCVGAGVLLTLQYLFTKLSVLNNRFAKLIKSPPSILYYQGSFAEQTMIKERVTSSEIEAAVRGAGHSDLQDVSAVVLESDGSFSVLIASKGSNKLIEGLL